MRSLLKAIIIVAVAAGIVVPAGYYSLSVFHDNSISLPQLVPGNSTMVIRAEINTTQMYAYNSSNITGFVVGVSMSGFSAELSSAENTTNTSNVKIEPVFYTTYRNYNIYKLSNVSLEGVLPAELNTGFTGTNFSLNASKYLQNNTLFLADLTGVVSLGDLSAVQLSLDTYIGGTGFQKFADLHFNSSANASIYLKSTSPPVKEAFANVYAFETTFNIEMTNKTNANQLIQGLSYLNGLANGAFSISIPIPDGNWVNSTITIGTQNYMVLEQFLAQLPNQNYTQYLSGFSP